MIGTLFAPLADLEKLSGLPGWSLIGFSKAEKGFYLSRRGEEKIFVDFESAPLAIVDGLAVIFSDENAEEAWTFSAGMGGSIPSRAIEKAALQPDDYRWLQELAAQRLFLLQSDLHGAFEQICTLRAELDRIRSNFAATEDYLTRVDAPPVSQIWSASKQMRSLQLDEVLVRDLPVQSWGLTRIDLWIEQPVASGEALVVTLEAADSGEELASWTLPAEEAIDAPGWASFDLERSLEDFAQPLRLRLEGLNWIVGEGPPWLSLDPVGGGLINRRGPALKVFATLAGIVGPRSARGLRRPTVHGRLVAEELYKPTALNTPPKELGFQPLAPSPDLGGLLIHPIDGDNLTIAAFQASCPAGAYKIRLQVQHANPSGEAFLIAAATGDSAKVFEPVDRDAFIPTADQAGVLVELSADGAGRWVRIEPGAAAMVDIYLAEPIQQAKSLLVATRPPPGLTADHAWAILKSVEFLVALD